MVFFKWGKKIVKESLCVQESTAASTHMAVWKQTCARALASTSWWRSDPRLAPELVSVFAHGLRLQRSGPARPGPARLLGGGRRRGGSGGEDLAPPSNTQRSVLCVLSSQPAHHPFMQHRFRNDLKKKKREKRLCQTALHPNSMSRMFLCIVHTCHCVVVASRLLQWRETTLTHKTKTKKTTTQSSEFVFSLLFFDLPKGVTPWLVA